MLPYNIIVLPNHKIAIFSEKKVGFFSIFFALFLAGKYYLLIFGKCKDGIGFLGYKISSKNADLLQISKKRKKLKLKRINYKYENNFISVTKYVERVKCLFSVKIVTKVYLKAKNRTENLK